MENALDLHDLPNDIDELKTHIILLTEKFNKEKARQESVIREWKLKYESVLEQFKLSRQRQFAASSEKNVLQQSLFDEADLPLQEEAKAEVAEEEAAEEVDTVEAYERKKKKAGLAKREPLPEHLPREAHVYDINDAEKICAQCGEEKTCFGKETSEQLKVIPPQVVVISHQRLKYCCKSCEGDISVAPKPSVFFPKSIADSSLVAYTIVMKYVDHLPLYRQEEIWKRNKIDLPRNTTCAWVMKAAELCEPLYQIMKDELIKSDYLQVDETTVQVLNEPQRKNTQKSYMWVYRRAMGSPIMLYEYQETRQAQHPKKFLEGFKGYLQTDAYAGYEWLTNTEGIIHLGCMAHARRPFAELQKLSGKTKGLAYQALEMIKVLYQLEVEIKDQSPEEKYQLRQTRAKPQLEKIHAWLIEQVHHAPPQGKLGQALQYMLNHWPRLVNYINDGKLAIDNNFIENAIRPFALGRKNWLFAGHPKGAKAGAILYSLLMTAKENHLNQHAYLTFIFNRIRACKTKQDYQQLLPDYLTPEEKEKLKIT